jgi:hypothetical protein
LLLRLFSCYCDGSGESLLVQRRGPAGSGIKSGEGSGMLWTAIIIR